MREQSHLRGPMGAMVLFLIGESLYTYKVLCPVLRAFTDRGSVVMRLARGEEPDELMRAISQGGRTRFAGEPELASFGPAPRVEWAALPRSRQEYSAQLDSVIPDIEARFGPEAARASRWLSREIRLGHRSHKALGRIRFRR